MEGGVFVRKVICDECQYEFEYDDDTYPAHQIPCDDCGSHDATKCPNCNVLVDLVYN